MMKWNVIEKTARGPRKTDAFASVGRNQLNISSGAVARIKDYKNYKHAEIMRALEGNDVYIGIRLLLEPTPNSLPIRRKKGADGKEINGITISDKITLSKAFGTQIAQKKGFTRYDLMRDKNTPNILMIKLNQDRMQRQAAAQGRFQMSNLYG